MTNVVKVENEKITAIDYATAKETITDAVKPARIKDAEGAR